jgi:hypothetical protein
MATRIEYSIATGVRTEVELTPEEIAAMQQAVDAKAVAAAEIKRLETENMMPRLAREFMLSVYAKEAADAGITLAQLEVANIGYRKLKALDDQIKALRAQL